MKKAIRELFELQNGSGWPDSWVVTMDGFQIGNITRNADDTFELYDAENYHFDGFDYEIEPDKECEVMELCEPDHITLLGELVRVVEHFFGYTGSMSLKDFAARKHLETMKRSIDEVGYKYEDES